MKHYDPKTLADNLRKASEQQKHRTLSIGNLFPRDEDDLVIYNSVPFELGGNQRAYISSGQGMRYDMEDTANIIVISDIDKFLDNDIPTFLFQLILNLQNELQKQTHQKRFYTPGSTLNLSLQLKGAIYTANVGDSRAILLERKGKKAFNARALSWDHKPTDPDERERIEREGGRVGINNRLNGSLALSRALGDCVHDGLGISHEPDLTFVEVDPNDDDYIINCCDGVVDVMREKDIAEFFNHIDITDNPANQLRREAYLRGSTDNITVCFTPIVKNPDIAVLSYVADGHGGKEVSDFIYEHMRNLVGCQF